MKNNTQNNFRLYYAYFGPRPNATMFTIPVSSIYEAALVKHTLAYSDLIKYGQGVTPDYDSMIGLEVFENGEWVDWYDEDGNDDMEAWLEENEPENYAKIQDLCKHFRAIRKNGADLTIEDDE